MRSALAVACVLLAACSGDPEPRARETPTAPETPAPETAAPDYPCPNQEAVIEDVSLRAGNPDSGDVDGDGDPDEVSIHYDAQGGTGCQAFVVAETSAGILSGPLKTWRGEFGLPMPTLNSLHEIDGEPGDEVVVNMGAGASTQFVGIVVTDGRMLRQVTTDVPGQAAPGMLATGGSVGHLEAVDCAPGGGVVASSAVPDGDVYRVERIFLGFSGAELIRDDKDVQRVPIERIDRFPEYTASPFGGCR